MKQILGVSLKGLDLFFSQSFFVANDVFLTLELPLSTNRSFFGAFHLILFFDTISLRNVTLRFLFVDHIIGISVHFLVLFNLVRVVNYHVSFKIKLWGIELDVLCFFHCIIHIFLKLVLEIMHNRMIEKVLPFNTFVGIDCQHPSDDILSDLRYRIDFSWKTKRLVFDVIDQIDHISCFVRRTK